MALTNEEPKDPLDLFEESVRKLKIGFDLFFAGARKLPPTEERKRLEALIHELAAMKMRDNARRFRFNTLLGRYNQFRELWSRKMREREEGPMSFQKRRKETSEAEAAPLPSPERPRLSRETSAPPESYVTVTASAGGAAIKELHQQIAAAQKQLGGSALSYEQVSSMVEKQAEALRQRYGVNKVAFRVDTSEGKVKLKAKPVQG